MKGIFHLDNYALTMHDGWCSFTRFCTHLPFRMKKKLFSTNVRQWFDHWFRTKVCL